MEYSFNKLISMLRELDVISEDEEWDLYDLARDKYSWYDDDDYYDYDYYDYEEEQEQEEDLPKVEELYEDDEADEMTDAHIPVGPNLDIKR